MTTFVYVLLSLLPIGSIGAQCGKSCVLDTDCSANGGLAGSCQHCVRRAGKLSGTCECSSMADVDISGATIDTECCGLKPFDCCDRCIGGIGKATSKCVASVWVNDAMQPGYPSGMCIYKSSAAGLFKSSGLFGNSTVGRVAIFPEILPTAYACNTKTLKCELVSNASLHEDFWGRKEDCEAVCKPVSDTCEAKGSCGQCLADSGCGWCSQNVVYKNGQTGSQCSSVQGLNKMFKCPAQYSSDTCTGTDSPVQQIAVGQSTSAFLSQFQATVLHGVDIAQPSDYSHLASGTSVASGGGYGANVTLSTVASFLASKSLPPALKAKLTYALPALMFAQGGKAGVMAFQKFDLGTDGESQLMLAFASARCIADSAGSKAYEVAFAYGTSTAHVIQQHTTYHVGCCDCDVGGCGTWIHFGCHGCDRTTTRPDTPAEISRIKQGLQAAIHSSFSASFPVHVPPRSYVSGLAGKVVSNNWDLLKSLVRKFLNRADTQQMIGRHSSSTTVTKVQTALKDISDEVSVLKIPQVALSDVRSAIQAGAGTTPIPAHTLDSVSQWVVDSCTHARNVTSGAIRWSEKEIVQSDGVEVTYFTVRIYYDPDTSPYVDLLICSFQNTMHLEKLSITTSSKYSSNGTVEINITSDSSPITGKDLEQFEILWKYAVDDAVLKALEDAPKGYISPRMRLLPFRLKAAARSAVLGNSMSEIGGVFDSLKGIISTASGLWQGIVSAFGSKTSQKIQIISQGGFTQFNEATDTYTVPAVTTEDTAKFIGAIMSEYDEKTQQETQQHLLALLFSHSKNDTSTWLRQHIVWGKNQSEGGCGSDHGCAEFFIAHVNPHLAESSNHWAVCAYKTDFVLAPTIELITTSKSSFGGLFTSDHDEIRQLPAVFTPEDETHLRQFMGVQCQYMMSEALGMSGLKPPAFPSAVVASQVASYII